MASTGLRDIAIAGPYTARAEPLYSEPERLLLYGNELQSLSMQARPTPLLTLEDVSEPESSGDEGMPQAPSLNGASTSSRSEMTTATSESEADSEAQVRPPA